MGDDRKVGDMSVDDLKAVIEEVSKKIVKDIFEQVQLLTTDVAKLRNDNTELKKELRLLKEESDLRRRNMLAVEDQLKRKNVIVKGLPSNSSPKEEFRKLCSQTLNLNDHAVTIRSVKKIYDRNNKMGLIAELNSEEEVYEIFRKTNKLAGTQISIEKDLNSEKQVQKKVMLQLKKDILQADRSQRVMVRDERMKIAEKWFYWNYDKQFTSGQTNGIPVVEQIYGNVRLNVSFNYLDILSKLYNVNDL